MSVFTKIVTGVFGKKSEKDLKILSPYVDEINSIYESLTLLSDDELINRFQSIRDELEDISQNSQKTFKSQELEERDLEEIIQKVEQEHHS